MRNCVKQSLRKCPTGILLCSYRKVKSMASWEFSLLSILTPLSIIKRDTMETVRRQKSTRCLQNSRKLWTNKKCDYWSRYCFPLWFHRGSLSPLLIWRCVYKLTVLFVGIGGLRTAIELVMLKCGVVVVEKRNHFTRNNSLHIWDATIEDLRFVCSFLLSSFDWYWFVSTPFIQINWSEIFLSKVLHWND